MNFYIYRNTSNEFLLQIYFASIQEYMSKTKSVPFKFIENFDVKDSIVLLPAEKITIEIIRQLKEKNNKIIVFDINDNSVLNQSFRGEDDAILIDLIFKISGVQQTECSKNISINNDFLISAENIPFSFSDKEREVYKILRDSGKIEPLPHMHWETIQEFKVDYDQKNKKALVRGGNHYYRYVLYLCLLKHGLVDSNSQFLTSDYFNQQMVEQFRYCPDCIEAKKKEGIVSYSYYKEHKMNCNNKIIKWQEDSLCKDFFNYRVGNWNNRCIPMFYWLSEQFSKNHIQLPMDIVEKSLNGGYLPGGQHLDIISKYLFYGDYKWIYSIYTPPRFWEAAATHSINLVPRFTNDQSYFPEIKENEHYITYSEDFSDLQEVTSKINKEQHDYITNNTKFVYDKYIKQNSKHKLNTNTIEHIWSKIQEKVLS